MCDCLCHVWFCVICFNVLLCDVHNCLLMMSAWTPLNYTRVCVGCFESRRSWWGFRSERFSSTFTLINRGSIKGSSQNEPFHYLKKTFSITRNFLFGFEIKMSFTVIQQRSRGKCCCCYIAQEMDFLVVF